MLPSIELRRKVASTKKLQSSKDFAESIKDSDQHKTSMSICDVASSIRIPLMSDHLGPQKHCPDFSTLSLLGGSSGVLKSLQCISRSLMDGKKVVEKKLTTEEKNCFDANDPNSKLVRAMAFMQDAKTVLDPGRFYFEAGILFDEIQMIDKSIQCFHQATIFVSSELIVDSYDLPNTPMYQRKLERMSKFKIDQFLAEREVKRQAAIFAENERQRLRAIVSHCQLFRLHVICKRPVEAHRSLTESFNLCTSHLEHSELMHYYHRCLKQHALKSEQEISKSEQLMRGNAGPLAEAHICILLDLLEEDCTNTELLEWLGIRYAEKCDFVTSKSYYKRCRDVADVGIDPEAIAMLTRHQVSNGAEVVKAINKTFQRSFEFDTEQEEQRRRDRKDFAWFGGVHQSATTIMYSAPTLGWQASMVAQQHRLQQLNQSFRIP